MVGKFIRTVEIEEPDRFFIKNTLTRELLGRAVLEMGHWIFEPEPGMRFSGSQLREIGKLLKRKNKELEGGNPEA